MTSFEVDLTNCDREPVHIPGHVQPHGALLALDPRKLVIEQVSANIRALLGKEPDALLGQPAQVVLGDEVGALQRMILEGSLGGQARHVMTLELGEAHFEVLGHLYADVLILELEPTEHENLKRFDLFHLIERDLDVFEAADDLRALSQHVAEAVRRVSGYDRVMIYRFAEDGHGHVFAEDTDPELELEPFLDLHYPASDIPKQVRALFLRKRLRMLPDAKYDYAEGAIEPQTNPRTGAPLDMTFGALRGSSPMYTEYLENMRVRASLTMALTKGDELWGLIACHHYQSPRLVPYDVRIGCEFVARAVSVQLAQREAIDRRKMQAQMEKLRGELVARAEASTPLEALGASSPVVDGLFHSSGSAIVTREGTTVLGNAPEPGVVQDIVDFVLGRPELVDGIYTTDHLGEHVPSAAEAGVAGVLAIPIVREAGEVVLWFRPERVHEVVWAGDPTKPVADARFGDRLTPRKSFEAWSETVRGYADPFTPLEREVAGGFRAALAEAMISRARRLRDENLALQRSNEALDAFAYVASHDLKEPLRGIGNYAEFLLEDYGDRVGPDGRQMMEALIRLSDRMRRLIDALLQFSRLGDKAVHREAVPIGFLLDEARDQLRQRFQDTGGQLVESTTLPRVHADSAMLLEVYTNLISNALKYSDEDRPRVEVGAITRDSADYPERAGKADVVLFVRDDGIGIPEDYHEDVFRIFKRLHPAEDYGGGTGAGLTIVQRIIDKHDGVLFFDSTPGEGTTFYFTLGEEALAT
ncbi:MAG: cyanobacterial phytochrome A [Sandaracinus sp.]|nr:cyanobacterial phytochrome A [Sandaracinus sp.]|tara:strand:+ start:539 stop:2812 length:2274 start_codon:yes stop_codon:yes gene_type:complete